MSIQVSVSGADRRLRFDWQAAAQLWADGIAPYARDAVKALAPVSTADPSAPSRKPGALRKSVSFRQEPSDGRMWVVIYSDVPYAKYVVGGTKPHLITPHNRPRGGWIGSSNPGSGPGSHVLHWIGPGGEVFTPIVHHPGTKPNDFPERAISPMRPLIASRFAEAVQEVLRAE